MFTELVQTHQQSIGDGVEFGPQPVRITPDFQQDSGPVSPSADADLGDALEAETVQSLAVDSQHELRRVPVAGVSDVLFTRADYNKALFEARLNNIGDSDLKFPWETGVMGEIFSENSDIAGVPSLPAEYLGLKRIDMQRRLQHHHRQRCGCCRVGILSCLFIHLQYVSNQTKTFLLNWRRSGPKPSLNGVKSLRCWVSQDNWVMQSMRSFIFLLQRIRVQCSEMLLVSSRQGLL